MKSTENLSSKGAITELASPFRTNLCLMQLFSALLITNYQFPYCLTNKTTPYCLLFVRFEKVFMKLNVKTAAQAGISIYEFENKKRTKAFESIDFEGV